MVKVGIPRALLYYRYHPMWQTFFTRLGAELVVSPPTTRATLLAGSARVVADTCLPVKVFLGHVIHLVNKCDFVFIPVLRSVRRRVYNCSKFLGLPDMTRAVIPECPPILEIEIDVNKGEDYLHQAIYELGRHFTPKKSLIKEAAQAAWEAHDDFRKVMHHAGVMLPEAMTGREGEIREASSNSSQAAIGLIGHPYLIHDEFINHRLIERLQATHSRVVTPEMVTPGELEVATARLGRDYWAYEEEVVGAGSYFLQGKVDGIIGIATFGCGPDSLMMDMVRREAARIKSVPFMSLTLEEHTADAGVLTRLEAFLDMIHRKKRKTLPCA
ncbi:MAG: hypothetical protein HY670_00080 [Chloroflexi bacterium]|nr:hypothetical protein [Chloroflexota bacterium]